MPTPAHVHSLFAHGTPIPYRRSMCGVEGAVRRVLHQCPLRKGRGYQGAGAECPGAGVSQGDAVEPMRECASGRDPCSNGGLSTDRSATQTCCSDITHRSSSLMAVSRSCQNRASSRSRRSPGRRRNRAAARMRIRRWASRTRTVERVQKVMQTVTTTLRRRTMTRRRRLVRARRGEA